MTIMDSVTNMNAATSMEMDTILY